MGAEAGTWGVALASLFFLALLMKRDKFPLSWLLKAALGLVAGMSLAATAFGMWAAGVIGWLADGIGGIPGWFGWDTLPGVVLTSVLTVGMVFISLYGLLHDRVANKPELVGFIVAPVIALAAAGPIAAAVTDDISPAVREAGSNSIGRMIGGGG